MVALGCSGESAEDEERQRRTSELQRAEEIWHDKAPANYVFVQAYSCFCADTLPARIVVENGLVTAATFADTRQVPEARALTIDGYFDMIKGWIARNPDKLDASYDGTWGFPREVNADFDSDGIDDEKAFTISCFSASPTDLASACPVARQ